MTNQTIIQEIYTDGGCINNPGHGGWSVVAYLSDGSVIEFGDAEADTTNNRMEMMAALNALKIVKASGQTKPVKIFTDSEYVKKGLNEWMKNWKKNNWKTSQGKPVLNQDLWQILDQFNNNLVQWQYVRGHSGNEGNDRADRIANDFARGLVPSLKQDFSIFDDDFQRKISNMSVVNIDDSPLKSNHYLKQQLNLFSLDATMSEQSSPEMDDIQTLGEDRIINLNDLIDTLRIADEIATKGYLISSSELADLMDINASAVTSRGDHWSWRNWVVSRVRREGNQILWQLEKADS
jgi:ribonuclease HI